MTLIKCFSCGAETEDVNGSTHKYLLSTPGCWARYNEVLAREYSDYSYMQVHNLTVDAYSIQHSGLPNPQTINSANIHLSSLYAHFKQQVAISELGKVKQKLAQFKNEFIWLEPPVDLGYLTINDVWVAENSVEHCDYVKKWARGGF